MLKYLTLLLLFCLPPTWALASSKLGLPPEACAAGWIALFDQHSLFGWQPTSEANWQVEDGAITVNSGPAGFLRTTTQFGDFQLQLQYRCERQTNSGVFVRSAAEPQDPTGDCYEINIAPKENPFPTGSLVARYKTTAPLPHDGDDPWHSMSITADGARIRVTIDGQRVADYTDLQPLGRGYIALQFRGDPVAFRHIRLRPLHLSALFNGTDLAGWKTTRAAASRFFVEDGLLRVLGGRGQLESEEAFADFVLQLECRTNAAGLNSGIFFRCIPGDEMMGYESQIHHGFAHGDRTQPTDYGTGGIFRRQPARRVMADDLQWFHKTVVAEGAHLATWVNGYQVADWTDDRPPHENPRQGLRTTAGTIMIQGHDPGTDLSFRRLRAGELPKR